MLVILLAVFAGLIHNGDSDCSLQLLEDFQVCQGKLMDGYKEATEMSDTEEKTKLCCTFKDFETCVTSATQKCGGENEQIKQAFEMGKQMLPPSCADYKCNSGNSIVPVNAVVTYLSYLSLYLSYFLYSNIF